MSSNLMSTLLMSCNLCPQAYLAEMERKDREEKEREKEEVRRAERRAREAFKELLKRHRCVR